MSDTRTRFPIYTLVSCVVIFGIALGVYTPHVGERWAEWFASAFLWLLVIIVYIAMGVFVYRVFTQSLEPVDMFWGVFDFYFAFTLAQAGLGMTIYLLDTAPTKDTWLLLINSANSPYAIFVGDFWFTTVTVFNTAGWISMKPRPSTVLGPLWGIFLGATTWFYVLFVVAVIVRSVKKRTPLSEKVMEKASKVRAVITPTFQADYAGLVPRSGGIMAPGLHMREMPIVKGSVVQRHRRGKVNKREKK